jgi:choline dehydrogenase
MSLLFTFLLSFNPDMNCLSDERDVLLLQTGFQAARNIVEKMKQQHQLIATEVLPGPFLSFKQSLKGLKFYASMFSNTYFHGCGTCPMKSTSNPRVNTGVIDDELRPLGITNLRVADASIVPENGIPNCPTALMCMSIGLATSDLILKTNNINK